MGLSKRLTKLTKRNKKHRNARNKHKTRKRKNNFKHSRGGANVAADARITYNNGKLLVRDQSDLTTEWQSGLLQLAPSIQLPNRILVTMTDPDAPHGQGQSNNHVWTHWVAILDNGILEKEIIPYNQPSPPPGSGIHRYQFNFYSSSTLDINSLASLTKINVQRNNYFDNILSKYINKFNKIGNTITYTVRAPES